METVNPVDILLGLLVLIGVIQGGWRGGGRALFDLLGWVGALLVALLLYAPLADWLTEASGLTLIWSRPIAFLLIAALVSIVVGLIGRQVERDLPETAHRHPVNRLLGAVAGFVGGAIGAAIVAAILLALPRPAALVQTAGQSEVANRLAAATVRFEAALRPVFGPAIGQARTLLTVQPESEERVDLPYTVADAPPLPAVEAAMLEMVNRERADAGLEPLAPDPELTEVARRHAADMFARGYFSHVTPEGADPFDRINAAGLTYQVAGENLALAPTLETAHTGLMESPGHRANILRPQFRRVGIGIVDGGPYGLMVTQKFRN